MVDQPRRNRRAGVEDRWTKTVRLPGGTTETAPSAAHGRGSRWRARYVDEHGGEHAKGFARKADAQAWLDSQTAAIVGGTHVAPRHAQLTVKQWCDTWIAGYANRKSTVDQARVHINQIVAEFGDQQLTAIRPSQVKAWVKKLQDRKHAESYVYALHSRLSQICADAINDGLLGRNPCSRRTAPPMGKPRPYVLTTEQVWALNDAMPEALRPTILLGAFAGLRVSETAALLVSDIDFLRGELHVRRQWGSEDVKTDASEAMIPIPSELTLLLSASIKQFPSTTGHLVTRADGKGCPPWAIEEVLRKVRPTVEGLPAKFRYHDLRHFYASLLISEGADIKTVQARLRHKSAMTTLNTYGHLWPDKDETTRTMVGKVIAARAERSA